MLSELKSSIAAEAKPVVSPLLMNNLEEHLLRCGIYEPFEKIYLKDAPELLNADMGRILGVLLLSQLPRLQICYTTGKVSIQCHTTKLIPYPKYVQRRKK